ncbi:nucleoside phosphorylase domain-containing protein [Stachybotrys elegans]|uniref:Nucleoside phosphorylase domain-containing protein n=1 Tax=Stachybotrys elegans TaxID=80388 RepID=A0A8K0STW0_9HYPO|nr:nucleoside phosphorylase domain-containing protein [Stachybotrys elegans]
MAQAPGNHEFTIAIICALEVEFNAAELVVEHPWSEPGTQQSPGDPNIYFKARVLGHNVVLVRLDRMGKAMAASAAASLRSTFGSLTLVLLVGVCDGNPSPAKNTELLLGDVVVGSSVVQYDLGRRFPDRFEMRETPSSSLGRPSKAVGNLVAALDTAKARFQLQQRSAAVLVEMIQQPSASRPWQQMAYQYPGTAKDVLFPANYRHKCQVPDACATCKQCVNTTDPTCLESSELACDVLGCDKEMVEFRERLEEKQYSEESGNMAQAQTFKIFFGCIASGDTVLKSGEDRDLLAKQLSQKRQETILAFEMEGAGVWDELPCLVVKGVCAYADGHRNKSWQEFAAATAAAVTRAIIEKYPTTQKAVEDSAKEGGKMINASCIPSLLQGDEETYDTWLQDP